VGCARRLKGRYATSLAVIVPAVFKTLAKAPSLACESMHLAVPELTKRVHVPGTVSIVLAYSSSACRAEACCRGGADRRRAGMVLRDEGAVQA
jgi:hypothetical protein